MKVILIRLARKTESLFKPPQTSKVKSGHVVLKKGESSGQHTTDTREEILIVRSGKAIVALDSQNPITIDKDSTVYIPPKTWHNVRNENDEPLDYIYITTPATP